ncbi:MAG: hypothetical protein HYZ55_01870, partial [Nitrosarchaeum sp.]|nr:hypothetical protein [Nitrosarchaeum sp.]
TRLINGPEEYRSENLTRCTNCGKEYHIGVKNFCSNACYESDLQKRIKDACDYDTSHTKNLS